MSSCQGLITGDLETEVAIYPTKTNTFLSLCEPEARSILYSISRFIKEPWLIQTIENLESSYLVILVVCPLVTIFLVFIYILLLHRSQNIKGLLLAVLFCFHLTLAIIAGICFTQDSPHLGYLISGITLLHLGYLSCRRQYVWRGMELMNLATDYIRENKKIIFVSLALFGLWVALFLSFCTLVLFIYSIKTHAGGDGDGEYSFAYGGNRK